MSRIAGHEFIRQIGGDVCRCGMRWDTLLSATMECVQQTGWACVGLLSFTEFQEIEAEKNRVFDTLKA